MNDLPDQQSDIRIDIVEHSTGVILSRTKPEQLIRYICGEFSIHKANISVSILDDNVMIELNKKYLGHDHTTDVISFDLTDPEAFKGNPEDGDEQKTGIDPGDQVERVFDILVNFEMAQRQGRLRGHSVEAEIALYITHGMLHNLGFDDNTDENAEKMHKKEDEILSQLGFGFVYNNE